VVRASFLGQPTAAELWSALAGLRDEDRGDTTDDAAPPTP